MKFPRALRQVTIAGVALVACLSLTFVRDVFWGVPASVPTATLTASCQPVDGASSCSTAVVRLNPGRFHIRSLAPASRLTAVVEDGRATTQTRVLLLRSESAALVTVDSAASSGATQVIHTEIEPGVRYAFPVLAGSAQWNRITLTPRTSASPVAINELGFFTTDRGLLRSSDQPFSWMSGRTYQHAVTVVALLVCALLVLSAWVAPGLMNPVLPWLAMILSCAIGLIEIGTLFSPFASGDLRSFYGADLVLSGSDGNLTGGLAVGARFVQGLGLTFGPDRVEWHRMPGYGVLCGLAALAGRTTDLVEIAMVVVGVQLLLFGASIGVFIRAAGRLFSPGLACLLGILVALLPNHFFYTQNDSVVPPIALLALAAMAVYIAERGDGPPPLGAFVLVNAAFALWFFMRNDVLPGWILLAFILAGPRRIYLAIPAVLILTIALSWGLYKRQYRHEFNAMPTNTGEVLFLGLCEVPGKFPYACDDNGYLVWAQRMSGSDPTSQRASNAAVGEVVRHWVTYPVHFALMLVVKLRRCLYAEFFPGKYTGFSAIYMFLRDQGLVAVLVGLVGVALAVNHQRRRTLLFAWALFFNMPFFFVMYSSTGRFYPAASVSLIVASVPLLFEKGLYGQIVRHPWRAAAVVACVAVFAIGAVPVQNWIIGHDSVHYWTPLLDPGASTLRFMTP